MTPFAATLPTAQFLLELRQKHHPTPERWAALEADLALAPGRRTRPVAVIDTNVLLDFWFWEDKTAAPVKDALYYDRFWAVRSDDTVDELADVIRRPQFELTVANQCEILRLWHSLSFGITIPADFTTTLRCKDRDDVKFLRLADFVKADFVVTKDKAVLKAGKRAKRNGTVVLTPATAGTIL